MNRRALIVGSLSVVAMAVPLSRALAQSTPTRLRGSLVGVDGNVATIATREGGKATVKLADNWGVMLVSPLSLADIKPNSFVGIASLKAPDGSLNALEVLVFPEAARGSNEGHYPWDLQPESMMTNATVATMAETSDGRTLTLKYKDGTQTIKVKPGTPIVTFAPGERGDAKPGAKVFVGASKSADGTLTAGRMLVGKNGLTPPM